MSRPLTAGGWDDTERCDKMPSWYDASDEPDAAPGPGIIFQWRRIPDIAAITSLVINNNRDDKINVHTQSWRQHNRYNPFSPEVGESSLASIRYICVLWFRTGSDVPAEPGAPDRRRLQTPGEWRLVVTGESSVTESVTCYMSQPVLSRIVNVSWLGFYFITSRVKLNFLSPPPTMVHWVKIVLNNCYKSETSWHLQLFGEFYQFRPSRHCSF